MSGAVRANIFATGRRSGVRPHHARDAVSVNRTTLVTQGFFAGLIGYATLAVLVSVSDAAPGRSPFHSAAVLGASLFYNTSDHSRMQVLPAYVLAYNGAHLLVFLLMGLIGSALAAVADRGRQLWFLALFFFFFVAFHAIGALQGVTMNVRNELSATVIWVAGVSAAVTMGAYLVWAHPRMRRPQRWDA